jgi:hemolysin activation/secretion protein
MKSSTAFAAAALWFTATLSAQPAPADAPVDFAALMPAQPDERIIIPALQAVVFLPASPAAGDPSAAATAGVDASRVPLLDTELCRRELAPFLRRPVSLASIDRLQTVIRVHLQMIGRPLASVSLPPQDVTDGTVRIVVQLAALEGDAKVAGARWFSEPSYVGALRAKSGEPLDLPAVNADVAWLNRNPFRQVAVSAEAGSQRGLTRLVLNTQEKIPLELNAGYSNTGTPITDTDRVSAGVLWGNAFGRGDLVRYSYSADPASRHLRSHSGSYTAFLPWRHVLTVQGAWSHVTPVMPAPFVQSGTSWQVGTRYDVPLRAPREGWTQNLSVTADFKYSDNTLEFAAIPITNNATHVAQLGATYGVSFRKFGGQNSVSLSGYASPGGLTRFNKTTAFDGSRPGAKADYAYGKLSLSHQRSLSHGFSWSTALDAQLATGALLGSEQLNGAGSSAVRGYRENGAFGDWGAVISNELHAPGFELLPARDRVDLFAFVDAASLNLHVDRESTDLRSAGLGVNYQFGRHFSARASYGRQLKQLDRSEENSHFHLSATTNW